MILGIDVGGTFTDAALVGATTALTAKAPTTPEDQSVGVLEAIEAVLDLAGAEPGDVDRFAHGMTVGTNALLEERGARTALVATAGFTDVIEIGRQERPSLYRLRQAKPAPLAPEDLRFGVRERCGPNGVIEALEEREVARLADEVAAARPEAVAICLLFSYLHPEHEERLASALQRRLPGVPVARSSAVLPQFREYERTSTTLIDAYLAPLLSRYLGRLGDATSQKGLPEPLIMRSSGGVLPLSEAVGSGAWSVLSGPAAGAVGASHLARGSGASEAIGLDMGGTSCDVCVVRSGGVLRTDASTVAGRPIQLPMVDVHTVGAGGGSIAWRDPGGALRVGPRSAGSRPGPACYGHGGVEPTVTDANLLLGRLPVDSKLAGGIALDRAAAEEAVSRLGERIGLNTIETALGVIRLANQEMARAIRTITVERGLDPREFTLLPFGGAGPLHAAEIAAELGIDRVLCPRDGGTLSALGLCLARRRHDLARTVMLGRDELESSWLRSEIERLTADAAGRPPVEDDEIEVTFSMRYRGQSFELEVPASEVGTDPEALCRGFEERHERLYGHRDPYGSPELVTIRVAVKRPAPEHSPTAPDLNSTGSATGAGKARVAPIQFAKGRLDASIITGPPAPGSKVEGPAVLALPGSTLLVPPEWSGEVDPAGSVRLGRMRGDVGDLSRETDG